MKPFRSALALTCALAALGAAPAQAQVQAQVQAQSLYVTAGKLLDVESGQELTGQCILTADDKVERIEPCGATPAGAQPVDWSGYTVLPGLIDMHTHLVDVGQDADVALPLKTSPQATALIGAHNAWITLLAGFTTVRDVGTYRGLSDVAVRDAINRGLIPGPRMYRCGRLSHDPRRRRRIERRAA